jgi:serine/threonine-protein kinase
MGDTITQIGRYEISRQLVDTALASVYDAFDPVERKPVAIRIPRTTQHGAATLTPWLRHPGLMNVLSYELSKGETFVVLEPFQGKPLDSLVQPDRRMEPAEALELLRQLASVLDYAHSNGSLHGSLHPSSILLNDRNQVKVMDLGAAGNTGHNADPEQLLRAVHYLAPECICDQPMDGRSDQFSLAVLAHALLTGVLPFSGKPLGAMFRIAYQKLERDAIRELPPAAQSALQRALSKHPAERFATCGEMVETLAGALLRPVAAPTRMVDPQEFAAPRPPAPAPVNQSWTRHFSGEALKYFGVTFVLIGLLLAGLLYFLLPKPKLAPAVAPVAIPAPAVTPPVAQPQPPPKPEAKAVPKSHPKKKEPEVDLKPVEPKIIRQ